jgi:ubiquinone biosynthesis protein
MALEDLGPTFIKLGQVLSTRADFVPADLVTQLRKLQDDVPPVPFAAMEAEFVREIGRRPTEVFAEFDATPLASASIGQVYPAVTTAGERVVVKIQRPGITKPIETDLAILADMAGLVHSRVPSLRRYDFPGFVREFTMILRDELVYTVEAHNAEILRERLSSDPHVRIPRVVWEVTTAKVLTQERIEGIKIDRVLELDACGLDRPAIARHLAQTMLRQIFLEGLFHGDPHPGNLEVLPDGSIGFMDFGMMGYLDRGARESLGELLLALFERDTRRIVDIFTAIGTVGESTNLTGLERDLARLVGRYYFLPRKQFGLGQLLSRMIELLLTHDLRVPSEFSLLAKALLMVEGVARELDPDFDFNEAAKPLVDEVTRQRWSAGNIRDELSVGVRSLLLSAKRFPRLLDRVLGRLEQGTLRIRLEHDEGRGAQRGTDLVIHRFFAVSLTVLAGVAFWVLLAAGRSDWTAWAGAVGLCAVAVTALALVFFSLRYPAP